MCLGWLPAPLLKDLGFKGLILCYSNLLCYPFLLCPVTLASLFLTYIRDIPGLCIWWVPQVFYSLRYPPGFLFYPFQLYNHLPVYFIWNYPSPKHLYFILLPLSSSIWDFTQVFPGLSWHWSNFIKTLECPIILVWIFFIIILKLCILMLHHPQRCYALLKFIIYTHVFPI